MNDETPDRRWYLLWALPASLILHALAAALLVYGQIIPSMTSQEEQAISVALVPPPDQPKPEPPAPPPAEAPKAEAPPEPKPEAPPEPRAEKPPLPEKQLPKPPQIEVLQPVFKFGDKDSGPMKSPDGGSAQDQAAPPKDNDPKPSAVREDAETKPAEPAGSEEPQDAAKNAETRETAARETESAQDLEQEATSEQAAPDQTKQEAKANDTGEETIAALDPLAAAGGDGEVELPTSAKVPTPRPAAAPKPTKFSKTASLNVKGSSPAAATPSTSGGFSGLPGVRKLNSRRATGNALATIAMDDVPRDQRAARLCASELQQQLQSVSYFPDLVPLVPLKAGNVLDVPDAAFRTRTKWYGLSFRCTVDGEATEVLSFTFQVGNAIPPEQWVRLGLPVGY